ncbi:radical SAM protein [Nitratidesulfovibrio vulgaris]|uniref:FeMo cofactor biosynthesis protein NifB n=1 Tax=Nitratidesulfovibrio vulgaris (strain DP4) TaxID=391774 RepID=A0A0H3ACQ5_NITV4|nr:radical SAM protein [Nitratidesulfovibrio vulgaris]ABM30109.1 Radical SAM domain protein [Nitratidesulfovibrio vulgaris DP4]
MPCTPDTTSHPCFTEKAAQSCGRVHLPVAPKCNVLCGYCNRKYDCVNESRPGVTSGVLTPAQAADYLDRVLEREPAIRVAGIAGPGDPMANAAATLETLRLIRQRHPDMLFCLSSNGLGMPPHLDALAANGVTHATLTINAVDPDISARLYTWVRDGKVVWRGRPAAELMLERQLTALTGLVQRGIVVKVNTILVPGINDGHVEQVAEKVAALGATLMNIIPLRPTHDTPLAQVAEPSPEAVGEARRLAGAHIRQMTHCRRCRADAVGLLHHDRSRELAPLLRECAQKDDGAGARPFVAVATREGMLVNQHLGEATRLQIWGLGPARGGKGGTTTGGGDGPDSTGSTGGDSGGVYGTTSGTTCGKDATRAGTDATDMPVPVLLEERATPRPGCGPERWHALADMLKDCRAVLTAACGESPRAILREHGITVTECAGIVEDVVGTVLAGLDVNAFRARKGGVSKGCCRGGGDGC